MGPYPASLPQQPKSSGKSQAPIDNQLLGLPGPYHRHVIGTFNTCSRGPTEGSLIDTGGGGGATTLEVQVYIMMLQKYQFELRDCSYISCHKEAGISLAKKYKASNLQ
jgi:hypothetical protein